MYPVRRLYPGAGSGGQPSFILGSGRRAEKSSAPGRPVPLHGTRAPKGAIGTITVQGVFHRLMVREGGAGPGKRRWRRLLEPRACARAVGMGLDVESSGGLGGLPWVLVSSLRWVSGLDWSNNRTCVLSSQGGDVTPLCERDQLLSSP